MSRRQWVPGHLVFYSAVCLEAFRAVDVGLQAYVYGGIFYQSPMMAMIS